MIYMIRARLCVCVWLIRKWRYFQDRKVIFSIELYIFFFHAPFIPIFILFSVKMYIYAENRLIFLTVSVEISFIYLLSINFFPISWRTVTIFRDLQNS